MAFNARCMNEKVHWTRGYMHGSVQCLEDIHSCTLKVNAYWKVHLPWTAHMHEWGVINASACMARFKAPSKFHVQSMHVGGPLEFPKHLFGQETPFGSFMHPMAEPRQSHWLPKFAHTWSCPFISHSAEHGQGHHWSFFLEGSCLNLGSLLNH